MKPIGPFPGRPGVGLIWYIEAVEQLGGRPAAGQAMDWVAAVCERAAANEWASRQPRAEQEVEWPEYEESQA